MPNASGGPKDIPRPHTINRQSTLFISENPWVFLVIPRTYFRANIPDDEGGFVSAYNLMMFAIVAVCLAAVNLRLTETQRRLLPTLESVQTPGGRHVPAAFCCMA
jgi:hypothetical protein